MLSALLMAIGHWCSGGASETAPFYAPCRWRFIVLCGYRLVCLNVSVCWASCTNPPMRRDGGFRWCMPPAISARLSRRSPCGYVTGVYIAGRALPLAAIGMVAGLVVIFLLRQPSFFPAYRWRHRSGAVRIFLIAKLGLAAGGYCFAHC